MDEKLLNKLKEITEEEYALLNGDESVKQELYTASKEFVIDSKSCWRKGSIYSFVHIPDLHIFQITGTIMWKCFICAAVLPHILSMTILL